MTCPNGEYEPTGYRPEPCAGCKCPIPHNCWSVYTQVEHPREEERELTLKLYYCDDCYFTLNDTTFNH